MARCVENQPQMYPKDFEMSRKKAVQNGIQQGLRDNMAYVLIYCRYSITGSGRRRTAKGI